MTAHGSRRPENGTYRPKRWSAIGRRVRYIPIEGLRLVDDHLRTGEDRYGVPKGELAEELGAYQTAHAQR
eukprot:1182077-Prorocentrum_minimum.AAC.2